MRELLFAAVVEYFKIGLREITHRLSVVIENHDVELDQPRGGANDGGWLVLRFKGDSGKSE